MAGLRTHLIGVARVISISLAVSTLVVVTDFPDSLPSPASAATLSSGICTATVGNSSNVTIAQDGYYCVLEFKNAGSTTWAVPNYLSEAEVLIVGGGGGGGSSYWGGGGGAGGVVHFPSYTLSPSSTINVVVGDGGQGGPAPSQVDSAGVIDDGANGQDSSFDGKVAKGGGGGGGYGYQWGYSTGAGLDGGSGGGTGQYRSGSNIDAGQSIQPVYTGASVFGNDGGEEIGNGSSGGGGGAGGGGLAPSSGTGDARPGGNGGAGKSFTISGTSRFFAAGGGGGSQVSTGGEGGSNIGGDGGRSTSINGTNGDINTGSGGGGAGWNGSTTGGAGGDGASGIVIVRFLAASPPESLIVSNTGSFTDGFFSSDGTWVTTTPTGTARISTSAVIDQLAVGDVKLVATSGSAQIQSSISSNAANSLTVKATGDVLVTQIATHISLGGGDFIAWADSDASNEGRIEVNDDFVLETGGGAAIFAGGSDSNSDGQPEGFAATSQASKYGLLLREDYSITTNGGNVVLRGKTLPGAYRAVVFEMAGLIDSGAGKISISGVSTATQTYTSGIYVSQDGNNEDRPHVWTSANGSADAINVYGESLGSSGTNRNGIASVYGSGDSSKWGISISATAPGGGVQLEGKVNASTTADQCGRISSGISLDSLRVSAIDGPISITGTKTGISDASLEFALQFDTFATCPLRSYQGLPTSLETAGTVTLDANSIDQRTAIEISAGSLTIQPTGTSFDGSIDFGATLSASVAQSLQLGKPSNTANITLSQQLDLSDSLKVFGGNIRASQPITVPNLAIDAAGQIALAGANDFDVIEVRTSKASPTAADVSINDIDSYIVGDLDSSFTGVYGVPKNLEIVTVPATGDEDVAFTISARLTSDGYQIPLQSSNHSIATLSISKAQGAGSLTGVTSIVVTSSNLATFSSIVLTGISSPTSASFSVSGAALVPQETGLIHFQNQPSSDASLAALTLSSGALSPSFVSATRSYQVTVPGGTSSITFTPTANDSGHQQIEIIYSGGTEVVTSGQASSGLTLTYGLNTFAIEVTAENGSTSSYTVTVYRQLTQQVDWDYSNVSITQPNGSVSTASAFTDIYGDSRTSALSDDVSIDEDGLPVQTITLRVGEVLYLPMTSNYGNSLGYGGISGSENHICKILSFNRASDSRSGAYTIQAMKAGTCTGAFVTSYQRSVMVAMLSLGARGVEWPGNYFRTPYVNIVVERAEQTEAAVYNGPSSDSSTAVWNQTQTLEIQSSGRLALGDKSYTKVSGPCTVNTLPYVLGGRNYFFMATAQVVATGTGACVVEGRQEADSIFETKTWSHTITFTKATQTLTFTSNVPNEPVVGSTYSPAATSSAMLPVTFAVTTGNGTVCSVDGSGVVSFAATGSCTIQASQAGDNNYLAATSITQTLIVGTANQSITFNQIPDKEVGDVAFRAMANASSGLAVTFTTNTSNTICTVSSAGLVTIIGEGQCAVTANQAGNAEVTAAQSITRTFTIRPEGSSAPFITAVSYGDGTLTATLIAPSYTGGLSILDYSIFAYDTSNQNVAVVTGCNASATPVQCSITGLTNGEPYTLKAAARTAAGLGNLSAASRAVTPLANPQAVSALTALADNQTLTITWQPPSSLGGGDFARFDIRIRPSGGNFPGLATPSATISSITESSYVFSGLQNGVSYDVEMITITTQPASNMSAATLQSHTARVIQTPFTRPNAPRNLAAFEVDNAVKIAFAYPDFDGGRQVDEYRVSVNGTTVCTPTQIQVCSVPMSTLTSLLSSPFVGGIGFQQQPGSLGFLSTTTQIPITVVAVNEGGTSDPATTTYNLVTGSSTPPANSATSGVIGSITNLPTITSYSKQVLQSTGDSFSITGTNFALISEIWASNTKLTFLRTSENQIRITTPALSIGAHPLVLRGSFGVVTVQDALSVIEGRTITENTRITREFVDGFVGRSTYLGPTNVSKLKSFVAGASAGSVIKCYGSLPDRARMADIRLAFKRADRVCDYVQSLNPNIEVVRTWVWKDGEEAWDRAQVRLRLFEN